MSKIKLTELPVIQSVERKPVTFRGKTNSQEYNEFQETAYFDITNMYNVINDMKCAFQEMSMAHSVDSAYTQMRVGDLPAIIEQLQSEIDGYKYGKHRKVVIYPSKAKEYDENTPDINLQYGQINIPAHSSTSKLYLYDDSLDLVTIPATLISMVTPKSNGVTIIDTDFNNCIRGYENEYFIRKVYSKETEPVEMQIEIVLPDNIISNRDVNTICISPYPYAALDIINVEYQYNAEWKQIPGFKSHKLYDATNAVIKDAENIKLCFNKTQMTKIRITLRQTKYIVENDKNVFYLGLKNFSVNFETVHQQYCTFMADINFGTDKNKILHALTPKLNNSNILSDQSVERKALFAFELYSVNKEGEKRHIKESFPINFTDERLLVVTNMYYDSNCDINPSLYKLEVEYDVEGDGSGGSGGSGPSSDNCTCILDTLVFNGDTIIIGADETSKPYTFSAACMLQGDCTEPNHTEKNIKYTYTIKEYGAGCRIGGDTMVVNSSGTVVITCTATIGKASISQDAIFIVEKIKKYTLTYLSTNGGGIVGKKIQNIEHGDNAEEVEAIPEYGYDFIEWSDGSKDAKRQEVSVTSSAILTAKFELKNYTVTFLDDNGNIVDTQTVKHGFPATPPTAPEKIDYLFTGWDKPIDCITGDLTVQALYTIKTYLVEYYNWDDTLIDSQVVTIHLDAAPPADPTREGYTFNKWSEDAVGVTKDMKITPVFDINTYTVNFYNWDGSLLDTQTIDWDTDAVPPTAAREGWHFTGWDNSYIGIRSDVNIAAQFDINIYVVTFVDHNGTINSQNISHGSDAVEPTAPSRTGYDFKGWDKDFTNVTKNLTVNAVFEVQTFTVTVNKTGSGTGTAMAGMSVVTYGQSVTLTFRPDASSTTKAIKVNGNYIPASSTTYTVNQVVGNVVVDVEFEIKTFTVTWKDGSATVKSETVNYGTDATLLRPATPSKTGYNFIDWITTTGTEDYVTSNMTVSAKYEIKKFTVTGLIGTNGSITPATATANYGSSYTFTINSNTGYHPSAVYVNGVKKSITGYTSYTVTNITEDITVGCDFEINTYTVQFVNEDGTLLQSSKVTHGQPATYTGATPTMKNGTFVKWDKTVNSVTVDTTITAVFKYATALIFDGQEVQEGGNIVVRFPLTTDTSFRMKYTASGYPVYLNKDAVVTSSDETGFFIKYMDNQLMDNQYQQYYLSTLSNRSGWYFSGRRNGTYTITVKSGVINASFKITVIIDDMYILDNSPNDNIINSITYREGTDNYSMGNPCIKAQDGAGGYRNIYKNSKRMISTEPSKMGYNCSAYLSEEQRNLVPGGVFAYGTLVEDRNQNHIIRTEWKGGEFKCAVRPGTLLVKGTFTDNTGYVYTTKNSLSVTVVKSVIDFVNTSGQTVKHVSLKVGQSVNLRIRYMTPDPVNKIVTTPVPYDHMPTSNGQMPPLSALDLFSRTGFNNYPYYTYGVADQSRIVVGFADEGEAGTQYNVPVSFAKVTGIKPGYAEVLWGYNSYYHNTGYSTSLGYKVPSKINGLDLGQHHTVLAITVTE